MGAPDRKEYYRKYNNEPVHRYRKSSPFKAPWVIENRNVEPVPRFSYKNPPENMEIVDIELVENDNHFYYPVLIKVRDKDTGATGFYVTPDGGRVWNYPSLLTPPETVIKAFDKFMASLSPEKAALARLRMVVLSVISIKLKDPLSGKIMKLIPFHAGHYEWRFGTDDFPTDMEPGDIVLVNDDTRRPFYDIEKVRRHMPSGVKVLMYGG